MRNFDIKDVRLLEGEVVHAELWETVYIEGSTEERHLDVINAENPNVDLGDGQQRQALLFSWITDPPTEPTQRVAEEERWAVEEDREFFQASTEYDIERLPETNEED
jgi:hypothetical protein